MVATVRSHKKGLQILSKHPGLSLERLSYVVIEDMSAKGAFDEAFKSQTTLDAVIHAASPFHYNTDNPEKDLLDPAVRGTTEILKAIHTHAPSVKRVVLTSSFAAMLSMREHPRTYTEEHWNPVTWEEAASNPNDGYRGSKTFAERAAWEFVETQRPGFSLTTINPPLVYGPLVHHIDSLDAINTSNSRFVALLQGRMKSGLIPTGSFYWVDVRDVAFAHVRALEVAEAAGRRFLISAGTHSMADIAGIVKMNFPQFEEKLPAEFSSDIPENLFGVDNSPSERLLGITYRQLETSVLDTVSSLLALGHLG